MVCESSINNQVSPKVYVIGVGMGNPDTLTMAAHKALAASELIIGSKRLVEALDAYDARKLVLFGAAHIAAALHEASVAVASVVMSGDVGFYSGATSLYAHLADYDVEVIPGISSLAYLCARLRTPWQDVCVVSAHGRPHNLAGSVQSQARTFVLTGGSSSVATLCAQLTERGLGEVSVTVGERLSYPDECIRQGTARAFASDSFDPLAVMLVENEAPLIHPTAPCLGDDAFVRGKVPMTKEEVRELVVCKLQVRPDDVVWDVGAGTGSVSVELARAAWRGQVLAIERDEEAAWLIEQNKARFCLPNIQVVRGKAPEALAGLARPDRVFVGGSAGSLEAIVRSAVTANPRVRLCVAAITLETLSDMLHCVRRLGLYHLDVVQVAVSKSHEVGNYHMMRAHNPVYLLVAEGPGCNGDGGGDAA